MPIVKICRLTKETTVFKKGQKVFLIYLNKDTSAWVMGRYKKKGKWSLAYIHHYKILNPIFEITQDFAYHLYISSRQNFWPEGMNSKMLKFIDPTISLKCRAIKRT
jgi:hypothetical protein